MKNYKVTFWNPSKQTKRVYRFYAMWNNSNHCWQLKMVSVLFESERLLYEDPEVFIRFWAHNFVMPGEYITIK